MPRVNVSDNKNSSLLILISCAVRSWKWYDQSFNPQVSTKRQWHYFVHWL